MGTAIDYRAANGLHSCEKFFYIRVVLKYIEQLERKLIWYE